MKKILIILGICAVLISMPAIAAGLTTPQTQSISELKEIHSIQTPPTSDYDGTFVGGIGRIYKENGNWTYDTNAYLAGVYKGSRLYGNIYNLEEEQIGSIGAYFGQKLILGYIEGMDGNKAPIIGFLFWNNENFAGRIMSLFGPAPHIFGQYTPN
jgi:hypothetical protein